MGPEETSLFYNGNVKCKARINFKSNPTSGESIEFPWGKYTFRNKPIGKFDVQIGSDEVETTARLFFVMSGTIPMGKNVITLSAANQITFVGSEEEVSKIRWNKAEEVSIAPIT